MKVEKIVCVCVCRGRGGGGGFPSGGVLSDFLDHYGKSRAGAYADIFICEYINLQCQPN